jgi:tellurite resistance protein TerC
MEVFLWAGFILLIVVLLALDLGVFHKGHKIQSTGEALFWTGVWIGVSMVFNVAIYYLYEYHIFGIGTHLAEPVSGRTAALEFFTGYLIEKSLSVDNIFVIAMVFTYFRVPQKFQHDILYWGIIGAIVMRGIMIAVGAALIHNFEWITYVFGAFLIYTAIQMFRAGQSEEEIHPERNPLLRLVKRYFRVSEGYGDGRFFTRIDGKRALTPLFIVLLVIETTDVMFAVDSIPAIFAITTDAFIVFTSNIFAILGLRSLYFVLASVLDKFRYLKLSLVFVLAFVGLKMLLAQVYKLPIFLSLGVIASLLAAGVIASILANRREERAAAPQALPQPEQEVQQP